MHSLSQKNFEYLGSSQRLISLPGLLFVLLIHAGIFYFLWNQRLIQNPERVVTLFAELITAPVANPDTPSKIAPEPEPVKLQPAKKPVVKPKQERLVAKASSEPKQKAVETLLEPAPAPQSPLDQGQRVGGRRPNPWPVGLCEIPSARPPLHIYKKDRPKNRRAPARALPIDHRRDGWSLYP